MSDELDDIVYEVNPGALRNGEIVVKNATRISEMNELVKDGPQPICCKLCSDGPPIVPAVKRKCEGCSQLVWLSESGLSTFVQLKNPRIYCIGCLLNSIEPKTEEK